MVGIDLLLEMLEQARVRKERLVGGDFRLAPMDAEAMQLPSGAFDCVTLPISCR
jgi:ubiquinone/menaquinone biosynthesis C-methylase UbiE